MTDFSIRQSEKSKGMYGKRTTYYQNFDFNKKKPLNFYRSEVNTFNEALMNRPDEFWEGYRFEPLSEEEKGIYTMLDELQQNKRFQTYVNLGTILASDYVQIGNFDYGPIFSSFGFNDIEDSVCEWAEEPISGKTICGVWKVIPPTVLKMISSNMESRVGLCLTKNHVSFYLPETAVM